MTTLNMARQAIYDKFIADWDNETIFDLDNDDFSEPERDPWVRLVVRTQPGNQDSLGAKGNRRFLRGGIVFVQIFVPVKTGTFDLDRLSKLVSDMFEGTRLGPLWFYETDVQEQGEDGKWSQYLVQSLFNYEEIK